jgi:uncharacterized protein with HEPN domain
MSHPERLGDYLEHIAGAIERAIRYVGGLEDLAMLEQDEKSQDAIVRALTVIGEAAVKIQRDAPQFVIVHPELPWSQLRGIRNRSCTTTSTLLGMSSGTPSGRISRRCFSMSGLC